MAIHGAKINKRNKIIMNLSNFFLIVAQNDNIDKVNVTLSSDKC